MKKVIKENPGTIHYLSDKGNETKLFTVMLDYISNLPMETKVEDHPNYKEALSYCMSYLLYRIRYTKTGNIIAKDVFNGTISPDEASDILLEALEDCVLDHNLESLSRKGLIELDLLENTATITEFGKEVVGFIEENSDGYGPAEGQ